MKTDPVALLEELAKKWRQRRHMERTRYSDAQQAQDEAIRGCADELDAAIALMRGQSEVSRDAWAIVRPDGVTIHPESVRGSEHAAKWGIGDWPRMRESGFTCVPVRISLIPAPPKDSADEQ